MLLREDAWNVACEAPRVARGLQNLAWNVKEVCNIMGADDAIRRNVAPSYNRTFPSDLHHGCITQASAGLQSSSVSPRARGPDLSKLCVQLLTPS